VPDRIGDSADMPMEALNAQPAKVLDDFTLLSGKPFQRRQTIGVVTTAAKGTQIEIKLRLFHETPLP
jgi:hypothetical protein